MANLIQEPTQYNLAYIPNVYTLDDLGSDELYYLEVVIDGIAVATFRQPANAAGVAHFNISKVLQSYLKPSFVETTSHVSPTEDALLEYVIKYSTIDPTTGLPRTPLTQSLNKYVVNGYDNWRVLNWDDTNYNPRPDVLVCEGPGGGTSASYRDQYNFLTNYPKDQYNLRSNSYHTLSFFNRIGNYADGTVWNGTTEQMAFAVIKFYTSTQGLIQTSIYSINEQNGLGPRPNYNSNTLNTWTDDLAIGTIGVGPQNLKDAGIWPNNGQPAQFWNLVTQTFNSNTNIWNLAGGSSAVVDNYTIEIYSIDQCYWNDNGAPSDDTATTLINYLGDVVYSYSFKIDEPCTAFTPITISFINQYGVKDYYCFDRKSSKTLTSNRSVYKKSLGTWNTSTYTINQHQGGHTVFNTDIETELFVSSNWMGDDESKWLEELYTSPSVQAYVDGEWEPVVIKSNTYEEKTYARDKMFQHQLVLGYSNNKQVQRG